MIKTAAGIMWQKSNKSRARIQSQRQADLIRAIRCAQVEARECRKRDKIGAWAKGHVTKQCRIATRARDKKENRANPKGKCYMPALGDQSGSSVTFDSDSEDSIPDVNWNQGPKRPQGIQRPQNAQSTEPKSEIEPRSARELRRSIRDRKKTQDRKEGCTCPDGKCKWAGECFSPREEK